jgi:two-component system, LytTR family, response regulator
MDALIVDDELSSGKTIKSLLDEFCKDVEVKAVCQTIAVAISAIEKYKPDVVFLDINMKGENGFDLLEKCKPIHFEIIFATAYSDYAIKAFRFSAIDYLLKPIDIEDLRMAVEKVRVRKGKVEINRYDQLLQNLTPYNEQNFKLALASSTGLSFVKIAEIIYCEADSNYTHFYLADGRKVMVCQTLKEYELLLSPHRFFRIHHAYLINLEAIQQYVSGDGGQVVMLNDAVLDVSKRRKKDFLSLYKK